MTSLDTNGRLIEMSGARACNHPDRNEDSILVTPEPAADGQGRNAPKAAAGVLALQDRLKNDVEGFAEALEFEGEAERYCQSIRAELRKHRIDQGLEQSQLGERMGLSQSAVSKLEKGEGDIGVKTLFRYADALGLHPVVLFSPAETAYEEAQRKLLRKLSEDIFTFTADIAEK